MVVLEATFPLRSAFCTPEGPHAAAVQGDDERERADKVRRPDGVRAHDPSLAQRGLARRGRTRQAHRDRAGRRDRRVDHAARFRVGDAHQCAVGAVLERLALRGEFELGRREAGSSRARPCARGAGARDRRAAPGMPASSGRRGLLPIELLRIGRGVGRRPGRARSLTLSRSLAAITAPGRDGVVQHRHRRRGRRAAR